jgi:hypothetical protein
MQRRQFLGLIGGFAGAALIARSRLGALPAAYAQAPDRTIWWPPQPFDLIRRVVLEWRYLAGRYTNNGQDIGFVCSFVDYKEVRNPLTNAIIQAARQELIVMREDFTGATGHATRTYRGTLAYSADLRTYNFVATEDPSVAATFRFDSASTSYALNLTSPELTLVDLTLRPAGDLIPEGGDGEITSGNFGNTTVLSNYYADWLTIEQGGAQVGLARLDMQTIRPQGIPESFAGFSHHWFALAGTLSDCTPVWISAWEIISGSQTVWTVTIARGVEASWNVVSYTEESTGFAAPLAVEILNWQPQPASSTSPGAPARRTGKRWRLSAGLNAANDLIDLTLAVPPGQFIEAIRVGSSTEAQMQEAAGAVAAGTVAGLALDQVTFLLAESTYAEVDPDPTAEPAPDTPIVSPPVAPDCTPEPEPEPEPEVQVYLPLLRR